MSKDPYFHLCLATFEEMREMSEKEVVYDK